MTGNPVGALGNWVGTGSNAAQSELGADGYGGIDVNSQSKGFWLDTQNTPGQVNISHNFIDTTAAIAGATAVLSFDIARQDLVYKGTSYETDLGAKFQVLIDGVVVAEVNYSDLANANEFTHYTVNIPGYAALGNSHTITLDDASTNSDVTGFSIDNVEIKDVTICDPAPTPHLGGKLLHRELRPRPGNHLPEQQRLTSPLTSTLPNTAGRAKPVTVASTLVPKSLTSTSTVSNRSSGEYYLDTQNTPGGIDITHTFTDAPPPQIDGKTAVLSFDIAKAATG